MEAKYFITIIIVSLLLGMIFTLLVAMAFADINASVIASVFAFASLNLTGFIVLSVKLNFLSESIFKRIDELDQSKSDSRKEIPDENKIEKP